MGALAQSQGWPDEEHHIHYLNAQRPQGSIVSPSSDPSTEAFFHHLDPWVLKWKGQGPEPSPSRQATKLTGLPDLNSG